SRFDRRRHALEDTPLIECAERHIDEHEHRDSDNQYRNNHRQIVPEYEKLIPLHACEDWIEQEHFLDEAEGGPDIRNPEKHITYACGVEDEEHRHRPIPEGVVPRLKFGNAFAPGREQAVSDKQKPLVHTPDDEIPAGTVPETSQGHGDHQIAIGF